MKHILLSIYALGLTTFREAVRNRVLLVALALALVLIASSVTLAALSIGEHGRIIVDMGLAASSGLGGIMAVAMTVLSFGRELMSRTAYPVLVRPLPRWVFVVGKFAGVWATLIALTGMMLAATVLTLLIYGEPVPSALWATVWLTWVEMGVITAVALFFAAFASPVLATLYSLAVVAAGHLANDVLALAEKLDAKGLAGAGVVRFAYYLLPDLDTLSLRVQAANHLDVPLHFVSMGTLYGLAYMASALLGAAIIFTRRRAI